MGTKTKIEWCDSTWNPVTGCLHGCEYCYAKSMAHRFAGFEPCCGREIISDGQTEYVNNSVWDTTHGEKLHIFSEQPVRYTKTGKLQKASYPYGFDPTFHMYRLNKYAKKKNPRNIFVCSMADLFGDWVPDWWIEKVFKACAAAPQHNYLFLTKNPKRYTTLAKLGLLPEKHWYGHTYTGKTGEMQYIGHDYKQFVSIEPLLAEIDYAQAYPWIIIGAETGPRKDKVVPKREWIEKIVNSIGVSNNYAKIFMKDSLIPIMGEENMMREFPQGLL